MQHRGCFVLLFLRLLLMTMIWLRCYSVTLNSCIVGWCTEANPHPTNLPYISLSTEFPSEHTSSLFTVEWIFMLWCSLILLLRSWGTNNTHSPPLMLLVDCKNCYFLLFIFHPSPLWLSLDKPTTHILHPPNIFVITHWGCRCFCFSVGHREDFEGDFYGHFLSVMVSTCFRPYFW